TRLFRGLAQRNLHAVAPVLLSVESRHVKDSGVMGYIRPLVRHTTTVARECCTKLTLPVKNRLLPAPIKRWSHVQHPEISARSRGGRASRAWRETCFRP